MCNVFLITIYQIIPNHKEWELENRIIQRTYNQSRRNNVQANPAEFLHTGKQYTVAIKVGTLRNKIRQETKHDKKEGTARKKVPRERQLGGEKGTAINKVQRETRYSEK